MKLLSFFFNILVLLTIILTSNVFHNDYTRLLDYSILTMLVLNFIVLKIRKYTFLKSYFVLSIFQIIYSVITVASHTEYEFRQSRISSLFSKTEIFDKYILVHLEEIWIFSFLFILILELRYTG